MNRIIKCGSAAFLLCVAGHVGAAQDFCMELRYDKPADQWLEALPVGNGFMGGMVFGGVEQERIQLNEDTLWSGHPRDYNRPDAVKHLPEIRQLVFDGKAGLAAELVTAEFMGDPAFCAGYQAMTDLIIETPLKPSDVKNYSRSLDLKTAMQTTQFEVNGIIYTREVFASHPDKAVFVRLSTDHPGNIDCALLWETIQPGGITVSAEGNRLSFKGQIATRKRAGLIGPMEKPGLRFAGVAVVHNQGGKIKADGDKLVVEGADEVVLQIFAATSFVDPDDMDGDEQALLNTRVATAADKDFESLKMAHIEDHQSLMLRAKLTLPGSEKSREPTNKRIEDYEAGNDEALAALLYNYGRYLLIGSSRPGSQPANLQGVWNDLINPPWGSKYTININAEMNYWMSGCANLSEVQLPLFDMIEQMVPKGRETAKKYYGAKGWVAHHNTDLWRDCAPVDFAGPGMWPMGAAWLCTHIWSHYEYTGDLDFLERMYPALRDASVFALDFLIEHPDNPEWLVTCPTHSPEHGGLKIGTTMDSQILRDLFAQTIAAGQLVGEDPSFMNQLAETAKKLPPNQIGRYGQLQEWLEDIDSPEDKHRHISHLWGVYPSDQISVDTPEFIEAAKKSLEFRGDQATGWSMAWKTALWARLQDGDHAYKILSGLLFPMEKSQKGRGSVAPNLFDMHPPFQIDGNLGIVAGMTEMLMQAHRMKDGIRQIDILPALPSAWPEGHVNGLRTPGGFEVDIEWKQHRPERIVIKSIFGTACMLNYKGEAIPITLKKGETVTLRNGKDFNG